MEGGGGKRDGVYGDGGGRSPESGGDSALEAKEGREGREYGKEEREEKKDDHSPISFL